MLMYTDFVTQTERALIAEFIAVMLAKQKKNHKKGQLARRDVHQKEIFTLPFSLHIPGTIPPCLARGLFAQPARYDGVMRGSAGAFAPFTWDLLPNIRGLALKIHNVKGAKVLQGDENSTDFDIILANHETFFVESLEQMLLLEKGNFAELLSRYPEVFGRLATSMVGYVPSMLTTSFYSQAPYRLGDVACKYALLPQFGNDTFTGPDFFNANFLREQARTRLARGPACFNLCIQIHRPGESIFDSTGAWQGTFIPVAELIIPRLEPGASMLTGEALSFNPARALKENEPLAWIGRLRAAVYAADFAWRTQVNSENST